MVLKFGKGNQQLTIYFSILIALLVVVLAWFFLYRTKTGYKLRTVGVNHNFARYVGINAVSIAAVRSAVSVVLARSCPTTSTIPGSI